MEAGWWSFTGLIRAVEIMETHSLKINYFLHPALI